jgi:hypothetical protein
MKHLMGVSKVNHRRQAVDTVMRFFVVGAFLIGCASQSNHPAAAQYPQPTPATADAADTVKKLSPPLVRFLGPIRFRSFQICHEVRQGDRLVDEPGSASVAPCNTEAESKGSHLWAYITPSA